MHLQTVDTNVAKHNAYFRLYHISPKNQKYMFLYNALFFFLNVCFFFKYDFTLEFSLNLSFVNFVRFPN